MTNDLAIFEITGSDAIHEELYCDDKYHDHPSPWIDLYGATFRGHYVQLTISGDAYSVQIDNDPVTARPNLSRAAAEEYVLQMTR